MNIKIYIVATLFSMGALSLAQGELRPFDASSIPIKPKKTVNLVAKSINWSREFCNQSSCANELRRVGVNKATCPVSIRVKNTGNSRSGFFIIQLLYTDGKGVNRNDLSQTYNLAAGQEAAFNMSLDPAHPFYRLNKPITAKILYSEPETNKNDNQVSWTPRY